MFIRMLMAHKFLFSIAVLMLSAMPDAGAQAIPDYKNPTLSPQERTADLLSRMTIEEKIGQTLCPLGWPMYEKHADGSTSVSQKFQDFITLQHGGMLWATFRADPWTQKTLETGLNPELAAQTYNKLQEYAISHSRLGIPVILAEEAPHGHMAIGTTVFPTSIGLASTWDTAIIEEAGRAIAEEPRSQGGHIGYGPVIDLAREPRWSRVEETYGEDVFLTSQMASAMIRGTSVKHNGTDKGIISTLKHFIAYGIPEGGHNGNPSFIGQRDLYENFLPAFKAAVDAGALSIMTSYNAIDGTPSTANVALVRGIIHDRWDLGANCYSLLAESFRSGRLDTGLLDEAAGRVLRLKFELGLFDDPYIDPAGARKGVRTVTDSLYFDDHSGVCGNEDAGQMSAWYIISSIGLYQVDPAGGRFVIGSPSVKEAVLDVGGGRKFTVSAPGNSRENIYVTAVRLNGKPHTRSWITYSDIVAGGTLEFDMGPEPSGFGSGAGDRP